MTTCFYDNNYCRHREHIEDRRLLSIQCSICKRNTGDN